MKKVKQIIAVICFCSLVYLCSQFFRYILVDDTSSYTRIMMHELYEQEENIDILFVGSSHCYRAFDTEIMDAAFGKNTFNAGSSSQSIDASYYLIKEAAKYNDIEQIYLELYFVKTLDEAFKERKQMTSTYIISDYMKPSFDKLKFLLNASSKEHYSNSFIVSRRSWDNIFNLSYVFSLIEKKQTPEYKNYEYDYVTADNEAYMGKGYVANFEHIPEDTFFATTANDPINLKKLTEDWKKTFYKIIEFCKKEGIELTLVSSPMSEYLLAGRGNYDGYIDLVNEMIADTELRYYDFNLCKEKYWPSTSTNNYDPSHLNQEGAESFSHLFTRFFLGQISESELFYDSYEERLQNLNPEVYGLSYWKNEDRDDYDVKIVSNPYGNFEYQVENCLKNGESYVIQDFSENKEFVLPKELVGTCLIHVRNKEKPDEIIQTVEIPYIYK